MRNAYFVYIVASRIGGTVYTGVTNDIIRRTWEHKNGEGGKFTSRYKVDRLVWFEIHEDINEAITREKRIKEWHRKWKVRMIEEVNPNWDDLYSGLVGPYVDVPDA